MRLKYDTAIGGAVVLDRYRAVADRLLTPVAKRLIRVNPDAVSWLGLLAAAGAGISFALGGAGFLALALVLLLANSYLDALDGKIAKLAGKASPRGDFLDHVLDRYADVFMIGGIAFSIYCQLWVGTLALLGVLLTSYMGTQAQAVGQGRRYAGLLGRADRLVLLFIGGLLQLTVSPGGRVLWGGPPLAFQPLEWFLVLFAVLGHATAVQRAVSTWRGFTH
ncbi:MAG TPA: CDP-alcohol phosphatidyltransferase family protein [Thermoplasmata archaeon]|nr:CDP-alcohol phosphatidyltransferase family protein [Thermoplasmata archaeon]